MRRRIAFAVIGLVLIAGVIVRCRLASARVHPGFSTDHLVMFPPTPRQDAASPPAVLLELFTSEGCSSCPPADALLARLNGTKTNAGDLIVGISEHVTYWNQLGWRDPYSTDVATERQNAYGASLHVDEVYTPQMVVNGEIQVLGSDARAVQHALENLRRPAVALRIASARADGRNLDVSFSLMGALPAKAVDIYAVIAEDAASSKVTRGENAGHTISHVAVATLLVKIAKTGLTPERSVHITLPAVPAGVSGKRHLVLFAQMPGLGPVLATDSVPL